MEDDGHSETDAANRAISMVWVDAHTRDDQRSMWIETGIYGYTSLLYSDANNGLAVMSGLLFSGCISDGKNIKRPPGDDHPQEQVTIGLWFLLYNICNRFSALLRSQLFSDRPPFGSG